MKNLIFIMAMFATFAQTATANESVQSEKRKLSAQLVDFQINQPWLGTITEGSILINVTDNKMELTLMSQFPCPADMVCAAVMDEYHQIEMDLISINQDTCGAVTYVGEKDKTPVDGMKEVVKVTDFKNMTCEMVVPFITQVSYETFNPWTQETLTSYFGGDLLRVQPIFFTK